MVKLELQYLKALLCVHLRVHLAFRSLPAIKYARRNYKNLSVEQET